VDEHVDQVFGDYDVHEQIGMGGMASVHLATHRRDGKRVALKRLLQHHAEDPDTMRAFLDEGRLVSQLHHPNIATTYDCGNVDGTYYIAMEYVPGHTLFQLVQRCEEISSTRELHGIIPFPITVAILIQLCDALEYAHTLRDAAGKPLGIIHRDISPANVILSNDGIVKLIDFGIAKATSQTVHSNVGVVKGKFSYMAPEYLKGKLDFRVDLWALGVLAHELLTNRRLFKGKNDFETIYKVRADQIEPPSKDNPDVPPDLDAIVMTALQREPAARWQSAGAMRTALANAAAELQTVVTNAQLIEWVEWTFTQAPLDEQDEVSKVIKVLEMPRSTVSKVIVEPSMVSAIDQDSQLETFVDHLRRPAAAPTASVEPEPPASAHVERVRAAPPRVEPVQPAPARVESGPAQSAPRPSLVLPRAPVRAPQRVKRKSSALRMFLMLCVLLAASASAAWYYGYMPPEVTELLHLPPR
jgi:eukaryotic-like serine/threonine-protein kinase